VSASLPSLHEGVERQPATVAPIVDTRVGTPPALVNLPAEHPHGHNLLHPLGGRGIANLSSGNLSGSSKGSSIQSRASDRFSIITTSRDSVRATHGQPSRRVHRRFGNDPVDRRSASMGSTQSCASDRLSVVTTSHDPIRATQDQPSRLPGGVHRQFWRGPDPSPSRERPTRPNTPHDPSRPSPEIIVTNLPSPDHENGISPVLQPSASSPCAHRFLSPSPMDEIRREVPLTSSVVDVQNPSTESSLPISPSTSNPIANEPLAMESATAHSSPNSAVVDHHQPVPGHPTSSDPATLDLYLPDGRFVQLINSDQVTRYNKGAKMQAEYTILLPHPYIFLQTSRGDML
jgi:hypothetical protein